MRSAHFFPTLGVLLGIVSIQNLFGGVNPDFRDLYEEDSLAQYQRTFQENWEWNFREQIIPNLSAKEKKVLSKVKLEVPKRGQQNGVFEFYRKGNTVVMPAMSLQFFKEICIANAWLTMKNYNMETVQQYVGMIFFKQKKDFPGGRYPRPLAALGIPPDATQNAFVEDVRKKLFASGTIFILCHELGHVFYDHPGYSEVSTVQARSNEAQADRFALEIMARMAILPAGAPFWFMNIARIEPSRADFANQEEWNKYQHEKNTHPLTAERIRSLAADMLTHASEFAQAEPDPEKGILQVHAIANTFDIVSKILDTEAIHRLFRQQIATTEPKMLLPRRGITYRVDSSSSKGKDEGPFNGYFACSLNSRQSRQTITLDLNLRRKGNEVKGEYSYGVSAGKVSGTVSGEWLYLEWEEGTIHGRSRLRWINKEQGFAGTWGHGGSDTDAGDWTGKR
jgi:Peptidase family M48